MVFMDIPEYKPDLKVVKQGLDAWEQELLSQDDQLREADTLEAITTIEERVTDTINGLVSSQRDIERAAHTIDDKRADYESASGLNRRAKKRSLRKLEHRIGNVSSQLQRLRTYAREIHDRVEAREMECVRQVSSQIVDDEAHDPILGEQQLEGLELRPAKPMQDVLISLEGHLKGSNSEIPFKIPRLAHKFARTEINNAYSFYEVPMALGMRDELQGHIDRLTAEGANEEVIADLEAALELTNDIIADMRGAFLTHLQRLEDIDDSDLLALDALDIDQFAELPSNQQLALVQGAHDIHWAFANPLEAAFGSYDFTSLAQMIEAGEVRGFLPAHFEMDASKSQSLALLNKNSSKIRILGVGQCYASVRQREPEAVMAHKIAFLRAEKERNQRRFADGDRPRVQVLGMGPGGLQRVLAAGIKGAEVTGWEKRKDYTRVNMVKIDQMPLLDYCGVTDRLVTSGEVTPGNVVTDMQIMHLQKAQAHVIEQVLGDNVLRTGFEVEDIRIGKAGPDAPEETGVVLRSTGESQELTWVPGDIIIDATGAGASATATILGNPREMLSEKSVMVAAVYQNVAGGASPEAQEEASEILWQVGLETPERHYQLVLPDQDTQLTLDALTSEKAECWQKRNNLQRLGAQLEKCVSNLPESTDDPYYAPRALLVIEVRNSLAKRLGITTRVEYDPDVLPDARDLQQMAEDLLNQQKAVCGKLSQSEQEFSRQINAMVTEIGIQAGNRPGPKSPGAVREENIESVNPFAIQIGERGAAIRVGNALIESSGDMLATPDPMSGQGAVTALKGTTVCMRSIDDFANPSVSTAKQYRNFVYGSEEQTSGLIKRSIGARLAVKGSDATVSATTNYYLRELQRTGHLTRDDLKELKHLMFKGHNGIPFSQQDRRVFDAVYSKIGSFTEEERIERGGGHQWRGYSKLESELTDVRQAMKKRRAA